MDVSIWAPKSWLSQLRFLEIFPSQNVFDPINIYFSSNQDPNNLYFFGNVHNNVNIPSTRNFQDLFHGSCDMTPRKSMIEMIL